jgi:pteridine reductase
MSKHKPNPVGKDKLDGKVALITGGAKRIGACIAETLHAAGMNIVIHYHASVTPARALQEKLNYQRKQSCILIQGDLTEFNKLKSLVEETVRQMGRLDVLINNASSFFATPLNHSSEKDWDALLNVNLKAPYFLSQAAAPHLAKHTGCIINLIDIYADRPLQDHPIYCASKAGLASLTRSFAQSLAPVRVNGIAPGAILWPEQQQDEIAQQRLLSRTPLKRLGDPQDIANTTLFLIQSAPYLTGQIINIDGGRTTMP